VANLKQALVQALDDMDEAGASFAVIGGLAVSARVEPRMTRDVDLAVSVANDDQAERLLYQLQRVGYLIQSVVEQSAAARLATARLTIGEGDVLVDLLFSSSGIEPEVVAAAEELELLDGTTTKVATIGHLLALKLLSESPTRPQDSVDIAALNTVASEQDWEQAAEAVRLITQRGHNRGKDLESVLQHWRARLSTRAPP